MYKILVNKNKYVVTVDAVEKVKRRDTTKAPIQTLDMRCCL